MKKLKQSITSIVIFVLMILLSTIFLNMYLIKFIIRNVNGISSLEEVTSNYLLLMNIILVSLFIIILVLGILLSKILGQDFKYIIQGFKMLSQNEHNKESLPNMWTLFMEEQQIERLVGEAFEEKKFLNKIKEIVSSGYLLDEILDNLFESIQDVCRTDRIGVAFINYHTKKVVAEYGVFNYGKVLLGPGFEVPFSHTSLAQIIKSKQAAITDNIDQELEKKPHSPSLFLLKKEGIKSNMIIPLIINGNVIGFLFFSSRKKNNYNSKSIQIGKKIAHEVAPILEKAYFTKKIFSTITGAFADLVEKKDNETGDHIQRMTDYSQILAEALIKHKDEQYRVTMGFVNDIKNNAPIHDIGKVGTPDYILKKPGKLNLEEWEIMKQHTTIGGDILMNLKESLQIFNQDFYQIAIEIARYHHERWDGSGYPERLAGQEIPLAARIIAIADVFDALSSKRVYKGAFGFEESVKMINQESGKHFDPELVQVFNSVIPKIRAVYDSSHEEKHTKLETVS